MKTSAMKWVMMCACVGALWGCQSEPAEGSDEGVAPDGEQDVFVEDPSSKADAQGIEEASWEGLCVLNFVNSASDAEIREVVHSWPGEEIVAYRQGADGVVGTDDDDLFESLTELDKVSWVGGITFGQLSRHAQARGDEFCLDVGEQFMLPGEDEATLSVAQRSTRAVQEKFDADPEGLAMRDAHAKTHGCVKAFVDVEPDLPEAYRVGVFADERTYPAWIRMSNGAFKIQSDLVSDVRGFALKVMDVPGEKVLERKRDARTQDFLFINSPTMFVRTPQDYVKFVSKTFDGNPVSFFLSLDPREWKIREAINLFGAVAKKPMNPLRARYWSTTPYRFGQGAAVKHSVRPCDGEELDGRLGDEGESYLREAMGVHLTQIDACFEFLVQRQIDPETMPVEDATIEWSESASEFVKVATIRVPMQEFNTLEQDTLCENLSFNPWHTLPEHEPLGNINRMRRLVYDVVSVTRHDLNGVEEVEPEGHEF